MTKRAAFLGALGDSRHVRHGAFFPVAALLLLVLVVACGDTPGEEDPEGLGGTQKPMVLAPGWVTGPSWPTETVVALNSVRLGTSSLVKGSVGVITRATGAVLGNHAELSIATNAEVTGNVRADTLHMDVAGHVFGTAAYNQFIGTGTVDGTQTSSLTTPVDIKVVATGNFTAGTADLNVSAGSTNSPRPNQTSFKNVTLANGTANAKTTLRLRKGTYRFDNLTLGNHTRVECEGACELRIKGRLTVGLYSFIGPHGNANLNVSQVKVFVEGTNGVQTPSGKPPAAFIGQWSEIKAYTFVPNGTFVLDANVTGVGKFIGKDVDIGANTELLDGSVAIRTLTLPHYITGASWPSEVLTAYSSIDILPNVTVNGAAAVITDSANNPNNFLNGAEAVLGTNARLNGNLRADSVVLNAGSRVEGAVVYNSISGSGTAATRLSPLSLPLPIRVPAFPVITAKSAGYTLKSKLSATLSPGRFKDVTLKAGTSSKRTTLTLAGGVYEIRRLTLENYSTLRCAAPCEIRVSEHVTTGSDTIIGPAAGVDTSAVQMFVWRENNSPTNTPFAVSFGQNSQNDVFVFAPRGTLEGKSGATMRGRYVARHIRIGSNSTTERAGATELPPEIQAHPESLVVVSGESATFSVRATGTDISFQWYRNNVAISGATGGSYTLANATPADDGAEFTVKVSNLTGSVTSSPAVLTVGVCDPDTFEPVVTNCGVGACARTGMRTCVNGAIVDSCVAGTPLAANDVTCDGVDDDCDGAIDDDYMPTVTTCGAGACQDKGITSCVDGVVHDSCVELTPAANDATCDGRDDDCDGKFDENFVPMPSTCGVGACMRTGILTCVDGALSDSCVEGTPAASDNDCDGIDDDCDGEPDQDYESVQTQCGVGACRAYGSTECVNGVVVDSCRAGNNAPSDATCDDVDDDCDGKFDENFPSVTTSCGVGACARTGVTSCVSGEVRDSCQPGTPAANDATCNGVDDDCNGETDEDYVSVVTSCGSGSCTASGATSCVNGSVQDSCVVPAEDGDGDGTPDCSDACPNDPSKLSPGVCGCGVSDVDSDADGSPDCVDVCPLDALDDIDGDGVCADEDNCPDVGNPTQDDADGDGVGDACDAPLVVAVAAGGGHACALLSDTTVSCWGGNVAGQLGNGSTVSSAAPVSVLGLTGVTQLSAGHEHTCARTSAGAVYCWGNNKSGQLGTGGGASSTPTLVAQVSGAVRVAAGHDHTCALLSSGQVMCWGANESGQLGDGSSVASASTPVTVVELNDAIDVGAGFGHSCALRSTGNVVCWGANWYGEIGSEELAVEAVSNVPLEVTGLNDAASLAVGGLHSCARRQNGAVACWGYNAHGQLGDGSRSDARTPVAVQGLQDATVLRAGLLHTCALRMGGSVACWGSNSYGQAGHGSYEDQALPVTMAGFSDAIDIATGDTHTCGVRASGEVRCWGDASFGQLGSNAEERAVKPTPVVGIESASRVAVGAAHVCALLESGEVRCWGFNDYGQLGTGDTLFATTAKNTAGLSNVTALAAGLVHSCALTAGGEVYCWGRGADGQLGNGATSDQTLPVRVTGITGATRIAAGGNHTCAIVSGGAVRCWGAGGKGQLGHGATQNASSPVAVSGITGAQELAIGSAHSCALLDTGSVLCWGDGAWGQLGHGASDNASTPVAVVGITDASAVAAGNAHTCAVLRNGAVRCWGDGRAGALGHDKNQSSTTPVAVGNIANAASIAAGSEHTCVVLSSAQVRCWGSNDAGQLGDGTLDAARSPVVSDGLFDVVRVAASYQNTCAVHADGDLTCWGNNIFGQLGNGYPMSAAPVSIQW